MADIWPSVGEEVSLVKQLDAVDAEADDAHRSVSEKWEENIRQYRGDQWRLRRSPYFLANIIKNQALKKVGLLTETKPQLRVHALEPNLDKSSVVIYNAVKSVWDRDATDMAIYRLALSGYCMGTGFLSTLYDPLVDDFSVAFVDPRWVRVDPSVRSFDEFRHAQYVRIDSVLPLSEIRRRFPGRGALVVPDEKWSSFVDRGRNRRGLMASILSMMPQTYRPGGSSKAGPIPRAEVRTYYVVDPQMNQEGGRLFPGGRCVVRAGKIILSDGVNPYWDGEFPIDMFAWEIDPDTAWGLDDVNDLRRIQESLNRMGDSWIKNFLLGGNFKVIADSDALDADEWEKVDNEAGLVVRKRPQREFRYEPPTPAAADTPVALQQLIQLCEFLSGNSDSQRTLAAQSGSMEGLQASRQTLIRDVARRLESVLQRVGQKLIARVFQFYTGDRVLLQQGASREWIAYVYKRQQLLEDDGGEIRPLDEKHKLFEDYRFLVTPESSLAATRIQRTLAALQLRSATGVAPSVRRILEEADLGDPDLMIQEGLEELKRLPQPPPPKGRGGRK